MFVVRYSIMRRLKRESQHATKINIESTQSFKYRER